MGQPAGMFDGRMLDKALEEEFVVAFGVAASDAHASAQNNRVGAFLTLSHADP